MFCKSKQKLKVLLKVFIVGSFVSSELRAMVAELTKAVDQLSQKEGNG